MSHPASRGRISFFRRPSFRILLATVMVCLFIWAVPNREALLSSVDERMSWSLTKAPPRRLIVWQAPTPIEGLADPSLSGRVIAPSLTDMGATLLCSLERATGEVDIYESRFTAGAWEPLRPVAALNSDSSEIGAVLTSDSKHVFFYSDRPGGWGGYDLYVASRDGNSWRAPKNLGPRINTAAHEYDPAISPDGQSLYFASNRTPAMSDLTATADGKSELKSWSSTLRSHPGLAQFDLYVSHRSDSDWNAASPVSILNTGQHNEGAPAVSANGTFLYFASDRPARRGEEPNLDLYRARLIDGVMEEAENLGLEINSAADETEPSLSPEGYRLVFSSNREGPDSIFASSAVEVMETTRWDTSRLAMLWRVLPIALFSTVGVYVVVVALMRYRDPLVASAVAARFVGASFLIHGIILLILAYWSLPMVARVVLSQLQEATESTQPFDNNQHQSHEDGLEAWEKLADVQADEKSVELNRLEITPVNIPADSQPLAPTISAELARTLPPSKVLFEPPPQRAEVLDLAAKPSPTRQRPAADRVMEIDELVEQMPPTPTLPESPAEPVVPIELQRQETEIEVTAEPAVDRVKLQPVQLPDVAMPDVALLDVQDPSTPSPNAVVDLPSRDPAKTTELVVELTDDEDVAPLTPGVVNALPAQAITPSSLERTAMPLPVAELPSVELDSRPAPRVATVIEPTESAPSVRQAPLAPRPVELEDLDDLTMLEPETLPEMKAIAIGEPAAGVATVTLDRNMSPLVAAVPTPETLSGPKRPDRLLSIGELAEIRNELPPTFDPTASQLQRKRATATRVAYAEDSVGMREMFTMRQGDVRRTYIKLLGSTVEAETVVDRGLEWIALHQNQDGSWSLHQFHENCKGQHPNCTGAGSIPSASAATGLAMLPFLAAGHTHREGDYQQVIARALAWLGQIQKENGDLYAAGDQQHMYSHSIATIALCEAYGMSGDEALKPLAQKALDFLVAGQHKPTGGWRYEPNQAADTSVVGWATMALKSGEMAGLTPPKESYDLVAKWLKRVEGNKPIGGTFGYQNASASPAMTAEGLLCLQFMGAKQDDPRLRAGADYLLKNLPRPDQKNTSYYWYYGTQAMFHMSGGYWEPWNAQLRDHLVSTQIADGPMAGTWDPKDNWEKRAGRLYTTSLKLLMLEVYYRHLPLYNPQ